jgi:hypothetical protein
MPKVPIMPKIKKGKNGSRYWVQGAGLEKAPYNRSGVFCG